MSQMESVAVHITNPDDLKPAPVEVRVKTTTKSVHFVAGGPVAQAHNLVGLAPRRKRTIITISGDTTSTDTVCIAISKGDAEAGTGAVIPVTLTAPLVLTGGDELWIGAASTVTATVGIIQEFCE